MAIRNIVKEGDPILNKVCRPVTNFDDRLATLLDDMRETMIAADGAEGRWEPGSSPRYAWQKPCSQRRDTKRFLRMNCTMYS